MSNKDVKELLTFKNKYQNKWVARSSGDGKVLAASKSMKAVADKLRNSKRDYVLEWVFPSNIAFAPFATCLEL